VVLRVAEFETHPSPDETYFQERSAPVGTFYAHQYRVRAKFRMPGNQRVPGSVIHQFIGVISRLDFNHVAWSEIVQIYATLYLRLNQSAIDLVAQVSMRQLKRGCGKQLFLTRH